MVLFLDLEGGYQKATVVVLVVISSPGSKKRQGFLNTQRSGTNLCILICADIVHRSTYQIFQLFSN